MKYRFRLFALLMLAVPLLGWAAGSAESSADDHDGDDNDDHAAVEAQTLPEVGRLVAEGERLNLVASTTIVGDVLRNVAGDAADVTILMNVGQNPHSYEPQPSDLRELERADLVFTNGLGLETDLLDDVDRMAGGPVVPVSAGIEPIEGDHDDDDHDEEDHDEDHAADDGHDHAVDPHVWMDPNNVVVWVDNMEEILSSADPANAETYEANANRYREDLRELDRFIRREVAAATPSQRKLVLDHESFSYFAEEYDFETVGTIVPGTSDRAEPSAQEVAGLVEVIREEDVRTILVGRTASRSMERLAQTVADEVGRPIEILPTLTGSLSAPGERGDTYLDFVRYNVEQILTGLEAR
ncbi:MAG: metal ABC transporter substrate-binding protein [Spirochaetota bacterium]